MAQPATDRLLSSVLVKADGQCSMIDIALNRPVTLAGWFPPKAGQELSMRLDILGASQTSQDEEPESESATVAAGNGAGLQSITLEPGKGSASLLLQFKRPVRFDISRDRNASHIVVTVADANSTTQCGADQSARKAGAGESGKDIIADGKKSLAAKDYTRAVAFFTKAMSDGDAEIRREAHELLGLARERAGQFVHAKTQYKSYLKLYPSGNATERVRQRLAGVVAAMESDAKAEFAARKTARLDSKTNLGNIGTAKPPSAKGDLQKSAEDKKTWRWDTRGSVGQFYYRDDGFAGIGLLRGSLGAHDINQNEVVSAADMTIHGENDTAEMKARFAAYQRTPLDSDNGENQTVFSTAYVDMRNKLNGLSARIGRQTRSGGGVFGRFDGALFGWEMDSDLVLQAVVGSPVYYRDVEPFADKRFFYGVSLDMTSANKVWSGAIYAIEQDVENIVDRRAVGAELRYVKKNVSSYAGIDYDVYYGEINSAYISGSWSPVDKVSVYGTLDYRHVPFLLTSNALMGQSVDSLSELIDLFGTKETETLAADRTASARTATAGMSYDISDLWQVSLEGTIADYSGTPASGGVSAIPDPGVEYYISAQLNGTGILSDDDYWGFGLRFLDGSNYQTYIADLSVRYPLSDKLRMNPRLRLAYRNAQASDIQQIMIMPSLGFKYSVTDHWKLESEAAVRWEDNKTASGHDQNAELLLTLGYRYEF